MNYSIAQVVVGLPVEGPFDYLIPEELRDKISVGHRVDVPFGRRCIVGYVTNLQAESEYKRLKSLNAILDNIPALDKQGLEFYREFAQHYGCALGEAIDAGLPLALRSAKPQEIPKSVGNDTQKTSQSVLCHDKGQEQRWPFIIDSIQKVLAREENVIFLCPEKHYLKKIQDILKQKISAETVILDKKLTPKQELQQWCGFKEGKARIVLGTRSAVFCPLARLGLIVVYEESHSAYKQEQSPFYNARDVAFMRSRAFSCDLLFVDSTPSEEIWHASEQHKIHKVTFEEDKVKEVKVVDLSDFKQRQYISMNFPLQNSIQDVLARGGKVLLFCNRRGFSTMIKCSQCGFSMRCPRCEVPLIYLYSKQKLVCTLCQHDEELPQMCPGCNKAYLRYMGGGVEKIESEFSRAFPQARIIRFDKESATLDKNADIIISTQAIFKVIDQNVWNIVGILDVDTQLNHVDFRAGHRVFSLLVRLRQAAAEKLFIQTFHIDHYAIKSARNDGFDEFYRQELKFRKDCQLPPFYQVAAITLRGMNKEAVFEQTTELYERLGQAKTGKMEILEPQPDFLPKLRDKYRFIIMVKDKSLKKSLPVIKEAITKVKRRKGIITTINVDP